MGMKTKSVGRLTSILGAVVATAAAVPLVLIDLPAAGAAPCPDVEIVFARGTTEPPGVGGIGQAFVDSLSSQLGGRSVGVYAGQLSGQQRFRQQRAGRKRRYECPRSGDGRELPEHQNGARRVLAGRGGG